MLCPGSKVFAYSQACRRIVACWWTNSVGQILTTQRTMINTCVLPRSVQVNGQEVARDGELRGMFLRHGIDITEQVASAKKVDNMLEITIRPPDHVGCVDRG